MLKYVLMRSMLVVPLLIIISLVVSTLVVLTPGDPAYAILGENASPEALAAVREALGLNDPFLLRYLRWMEGVLQGDLGTSLFNNVPVTTALLARAPVTISLICGAIIVSICVGLPSGIIAGYRQGSRFDRFFTLLAGFTIAMPEFWICLMVIFIFGMQLGWAPQIGFVPFSESPAQYFLHLVLPVAALSLPGTGELFRQARAAAADVARKDFVRTGRAAGLWPSRIVAVHVAKNAMIPVVTVAGLQVAKLIGLAAVAETIFGMQGVGAYAVQAAQEADLPVIQGVVLVTATVVLLVNVLVDISYYYFNPRMRSR